MKHSTKPTSNLKKLITNENSKTDMEIIIIDSDENENENIPIKDTKKIPNVKIDNFNQISKPKKQMLLNGEVAPEHFKKPQRRSRSCTQINSKLNKKSKQKSSSNQNLLELWSNIRRSDRCPEKLLKDRKEQLVLNSIINKKEDGMRIIQTAEKGRGVESTIWFNKDSFIVEYAGKLISEKEAREKEAIYKKDSSKGSYMFYFRYKESKYCVDATEESGRLGRLLNHSKLNPNCYVKVMPINDVPRLTIFAKREIEIGEELVYDYGDRDKDTLEANPWLKF